VRVKFADINGVRTRYLYAGNGPPLLLLHGVGMSADCVLRNIDPLASRFSVFAPDLLGHGFTDAADLSGAAAQLAMAKHIVQLADGLALGSFSALGFSFGALVAALIYFERRKQVRNLVLVGSGSTFHPSDQQKKTLRAAATNGKTAMADPTLESCGTRASNVVCDPSVIPAELIWIQLTVYALPDRLAAYMETIESCIVHLEDASTRVFDRLEQIACPTKVIMGRDDIRADWRWHEKGVARMPDASLTVYERCGHMPFLEHAEQFNSEVSSFVGGGGFESSRASSQELM
jgi:2-hydroxy-6-oxonona-2,4-dienedioate hydrolase